MLVGYVSDERYVALADVGVEFEQNGKMVAVTKSTPRGGVYADIAPGEYRVTLVKEGYGSKHVTAAVTAGAPYQFRLLTDRILGYMWPKWVKAGERGEFRIHAPEAYRLSLWRYGLQKEFVRLISWIDEHGPRANVQLTPDGDYTQTGVQWNKIGYGSPQHHQLIAGPERSGLYYLHAEGESGAFFSFPWVVAPATPQAPIAVLASTNTWNAYNNFGGRSNYINADHLPERPVVNARLDMTRYQQANAYTEWGRPDDAYLPLSFERPEPCNNVTRDVEATGPLAGRQQCHLAPGEWRVLAWLEREGFDVARCTMRRLLKDRGLQGSDPWQATSYYDQRQGGGVSARSPAIPRGGTKRAVGLRLYLRLHLDRLCLCCLRDRRLCPAHWRLALHERSPSLRSRQPVRLRQVHRAPG